jgi:hypothetical protein
LDGVIDQSGGTLAGCLFPALLFPPALIVFIFSFLSLRSFLFTDNWVVYSSFGRQSTQLTVPDAGTL